MSETKETPNQPVAPPGQIPCVLPNGLIQRIIDFLAMHPEKEKELGMARRFELIDQLRKAPTLQEFMVAVEQQTQSQQSQLIEAPKPPAKSNHKGKN